MMGWMPSPASLSFAPDLPLKFVGGDASLDFVNTVDYTPVGLTNDRLVDYGRLLEWGRRTGLVDRGEAARLSRAGRAHPDAAGRAYERARAGRSTLQRLFTSVARGAASPDALDELNDLLRRASTDLSLVFASRDSASATTTRPVRARRRPPPASFAIAPRAAACLRR